MSQSSDTLSLPYIQGAQAQKHVTHNEAIERLDLLVQMCLEADDATQPPAVSDPGAGWALGQGAEGAWAGRDGQIAVWSGAAGFF